MIIKILLRLLELIPYKNRYGLNLSDLLKEFSFHTLRNQKKCMCGGKIVISYHSFCEDDVGWEIYCNRCDYLYGED